MDTTSSTSSSNPHLDDSKIAGIIFGAALGDTLGFCNGQFEFCYDAKTIHDRVKRLIPKEITSSEQYPISHIHLDGWRVSDDTVMHTATIQALLSWYQEELCNEMKLRSQSSNRNSLNDDSMRGNSSEENVSNEYSSKETSSKEDSAKENLSTVDSSNSNSSTVDSSYSKLSTENLSTENVSKPTTGLLNRIIPSFFSRDKKKQKQEESSASITSWGVFPSQEKIKSIGNYIAKAYVDCFKHMDRRSPGNQCIVAVHFLQSTSISNWINFPYSKTAGGCGGSMRAMGIALFYSQWEDLNDLVAVALESGRITHNNATGALGAVAAAVFTLFALQKVPIELWPLLLIEDIIPRTLAYVRTSNRNVKEYEADAPIFVAKWKQYMDDRLLNYDLVRKHVNISNLQAHENVSNLQKNHVNNSNPQTHVNYSIQKLIDTIDPSWLPTPFYPKDFEDESFRDTFYNRYAYSGWFGSSGDDSVIVAYDCLLGCRENLNKLIYWSCFNAGDSDSIGTIALSWYGGLYGSETFYTHQMKELEWNEQLEKLVKDVSTLLHTHAYA